ncbi:alpha/beta hydrolase family protein [Rugamonas apoptosis]|uniref:Prolyl oligopeptidase family serine peptidase n=1 Tax=Rugamonas apoptosis TaxID=2758570 RepID=A0A7W2IMQ0_9BURK|nr:lipase family protein [Rugamonas apoptosis]MBA5689776.1 prolyl oligopeptidase family serine peptidase [Rugamonas apoptosis]
MPPAPPAGTLLDGPTLVPIPLGGGASVETLEPATLGAVLKRAQGGALMAIAGEPLCSITVYQMRYTTGGGRGEATDAGGVLMLPGGEDQRCMGPRPVLLYAHGTVLDRNFSMARLNGEARVVAAMFVAQGYIVVAPDYAGYGVSSLPYHPYLNADQQAGDMIDALRAARTALPRLGARTSQKLFVTGYSQGGFVALATQRAMQDRYPDEFRVTATAGLSGPYALLQMADDIFSGRPNVGITAYLPLLTTAGQKSGATLYTSPAELYEEPYADGIESVLPATQRMDDLIKQGKLPAGALFAGDPPPQGEAAPTHFADSNLVRTSYRKAYLQDVAAHPCGTDLAQPLACHSANRLRQWLQKNDLRNYQPRSPLLLCGGQRDPVVPFANASAAYDYFVAHGVAPQLLDLEAAGPDAYPDIHAGFAQTVERMRADAIAHDHDPRKAVLDNYHGRLVAQYCLMAAREFFRMSAR